jgi:hypothetical protein
LLPEIVTMLLPRLSCLAALLLAILACAGQDRERPAVQPAVRRVDLHENRISLTGALAEIRRQTGVTIADDSEQPEQAISLDLRQATFWQAVDAVAAAGKLKTVVSERDGTVRLVPRRPADRLPPTSYDGDFRVRVLRTTGTRDFDSDRAQCTVSLEVAWTPTLRPLFLESQVQELQVRDQSNRPVAVNAEPSSLVAVDGRLSHPIDLLLPGFSRADRVIGELSGKLSAIAPSKILAFRFDANLKALDEAAAGGEVRRLTLDDVTCRLATIKLERNRWSISVGLEYPEGSLHLESFQAASLVVNNELALSSKDGKRTLSPSSNVVEYVTSRKALVTYHFTDGPRAKRGTSETWYVQYRAPARIVSVPLRFTFRNVPLP